MSSASQIFVVCAPSGAGKSSLVRACMQADPRLTTCISHTTRAPRGKEVNGEAYYFVSDAEFDALIKQDVFVEWAFVHGNRYGTSHVELDRKMQQGHDVMLEIDVQGARNIRRAFPKAVLVFVLPPSLEVLQKRLEQRAEDSSEVIALRLDNAKKEMQSAQEFDFVIINDRFEDALAELQTIVRTQRLKS